VSINQCFGLRCERATPAEFTLMRSSAAPPLPGPAAQRTDAEMVGQLGLKLGAVDQGLADPFRDMDGNRHPEKVGTQQ